MKGAAVAFAVALTALAAPVRAHRLDEYLQATILAVGPDRIRAELYLTPGVATLSAVLADIGVDDRRDVPAAAGRAYARRVLGDLALTIDGRPAAPRLQACTFPPMEELKAGRGDIRVDFAVAVPAGAGRRTFTLANHHRAGIAVYQVNCLVPADPAVRIISERRSFDQSRYELDYEVAAPGRRGLAASAGTTCLVAGSFLLAAILAGLRRARARRPAAP